MFRKKFLRKVIVASVVVGSLTFAPEIYCLPIGTAVVHAEIKQYVGVGESIVSDRETLEIGKEGARLQAIRNAQKQAGVFIGSYSVVKDHELDTDEVVAFTAGIVKVGNVSYEPVPVEQWIKYRATVTVTLDTDDLNGQINRWLGINAQDRSTITEQTKALNGTLDMIQTRTVELETAVAGATVDSAKVKEELKQIDRDILYAQKISEGNALMRKGDRAGAMKLYQEAIALYPKDATLAYEKVGDSYFQAKDYARAIDAYSKVIQMDPNYDLPYQKCGRIYFIMKDYQKAVTYLEKANEITPKQPSTWSLLYDAYINLDDIDSALKFFGSKLLHQINSLTKKIKAGQNLADNYFQRGCCYVQLENMDRRIERAIQDFDKVIELDPNNIGAYYARGCCYGEQKLYERAIQDFDKIIALDPNYVEAYKLRGLSYREMKQYLEAFKDYKKIIELNPNDADAYEDCAEFCQDYLRQYELAISYYEKEFKLRKHSYYPRLWYFRIGECYEKLGDTKNAIKICTAASKDERLNEKDRSEFKKKLERLKKAK